jgi:hypothetical protein
LFQDSDGNSGTVAAACILIRGLARWWYSCLLLLLLLLLRLPLLLPLLWMALILSY